MLFTSPKLGGKEVEVVQRVDSLRERLSYATQRPKRWTGLLRRSTFARAIQGSNSIEGYNVTFEDAVAAVDDEEPLEAGAETWEAIKGYRDAMTYVLQLADDPFFRFSEGFLRSLHFMMLRYDLSKNPGRWRPGYIYVRNDLSEEIVYEGPDVDLVPSLMRELVQSLNAPDDLPAMIRAALAHLNLVMIHPFSDGNGRMARALQSLVLAREGVVAPEFASIEEYLGRNTRAYYDVLAEVGAGRWRPERDTRPWVRFCLTAHYRQATTLLRRLKEYERIWAELEIEVARRRLPERMILALFDATLGWRVRNSSYRKAAELSDDVAGRDLKTLVREGLLAALGEKRGRRYAAAEPLRALRSRTREPRSVEDPFDERQPMFPGFEPGGVTG